MQGSNVVGGEGCHKTASGLGLARLFLSNFAEDPKSFIFFSLHNQKDHNSNHRQPATKPHHAAGDSERASRLTP